MISMNISYKANIDREENTHYKSLVEQLMHDGKIDDKHLLMLDANDIANVIYLSVLYHSDMASLVESHKKEIEVKYKKQHSAYFTGHYKYLNGPHNDCHCALCNTADDPVNPMPIMNAEIKTMMNGFYATTKWRFSSIKNIDKPFGMLSFDTRMSIAKSIGLNTLINNGLDELPSFEMTFQEYNEREKAKQ